MLTVNGPTSGPHVCAFAREYCTHTVGRWAGRPFVFEDWQRDLLDEVFLLDEDGKRVYRNVLIGVPRKNGKSSIAAVLALYLAGPDGEAGPQVILAAASRDQANIVFDQTRSFVDASPMLSDWFTSYRYSVFCDATQGVIKPISSEGKTAHGLNPHATIIDELHSFNSPKHSELYDALNTGSQAREEPLTINITTAGYDRNTILGRLYDAALALPDVEHRPGLTIARDPESGFLMYWYAAPDDADVDDESQWMLANPASWVTVEELRKQRSAPGLTEAAFRRLHLNQWTSAAGSWLTHNDWEACRGDVEWEPGEKVWLALDVASKHDRTAIAMVARDGEGYKAEAFVFEAEESATEMIVRAKLKLNELGRTYNVQEIAYDPWRIDISTADSWSNEGLPMVEFPQSDARMCPATQGLYSLVKERRIQHDGDHVLAAHVAAAVAVETERGFRLKKKASTRPVDACIALVMAVSRASAGDGDEGMWVMFTD